MTPIELVEILRREVIDGNLKINKDILEKTKEAEATEPIWKSFLPVYNKLNSSEKTSFLNFLRLSQVNILSHVLGILDGTSSAFEFKENFVLTTELSGEQLNGDLQDIFLELEEG